MSIITKTGDQGTTGLMYNRRVPKTHPRVEAYGTVDELNAALGLARATATDEWEGGQLLAIQKELVILMGELAVLGEDLARYRQDGYSIVTAEMAMKLELIAKEIEARKIVFKGWATPGATLHSAALDVARTICRRAERRVCALEGEQKASQEITIYLNRLSDLLWLLARRTETECSANE